MRPKLACADFTFPLLPHGDALRLISMLEFGGVDIGLFENRSHLQPSGEFESLPGSARRLKMKLDDLGLKAADVFLQTDADPGPFASNHPLASRRRKARDWFCRTLDYAAECGCRHVTALPGVRFGEESLKASFERAVDELGWRVEQAGEYEIVFGVEAHIGSIAPRPKSAEHLVRRVPGLTLTLDYTHFTKIGLSDSEVEPLVKHASHFHVRGGRRGRLQERFDRNVIDYKRVFKAMQDTGYRGWIGIEYVWTAWERCNECDNLTETIRYRDYFRSLTR